MRHLLATALASLLLASCVADPVESTTTETALTTTTTQARETTTTPAETTTTSLPPGEEFPVYFFFDGFPVEPGPYLAPVARSGAAEIGDALTALLSDVTEAESEMGLSSAIPEGTALLGVGVANGIASIDLSREFESGGGSLSVLGRVAQVVYTATWFEDIDAVEFLIEGVPVDVLTGEGLIVDRPQTRSDYLDLLPAIFIDEPSWGSGVVSTMTVSGLALTESGVVHYVVVDADGLIVAEGDITTIVGDRSEFTTTVDLGSVVNPGLGSIIVFESDPDGTQLHVLEYPLTIRE
jgi:spore germination protein GerM